VPIQPCFVTTGLDPVVHAGSPGRMDCRIKSGNDETQLQVRHARLYAGHPRL
jgi:hypothetical protein